MILTIVFAAASSCLVLILAWFCAGVLAFDGDAYCLKNYLGSDPLGWSNIRAIDRSYFPIRNVCTFDSGERQDVAPGWTNILVYVWLIFVVVVVAVEVRRAYRWMVS